MDPSDIVDQIAFDPYLHEADVPTEWTQIGYYKWATSPAPGKPIMLPEWNLDLPRA